MVDALTGSASLAIALPLAGVFASMKAYLLVFIGFSLVIFVHELGHFMAAKLCRVRVDKFAVGFGRAVCAYRKGVGFCWGSAYPRFRRRVDAYIEQKRQNEPQHEENQESSESQIIAAGRELGIGETEYCLNILPLGGYVKMLGQEDFAVDKSGELRVKSDPRAFTNKPISQRMFIVSAGVVMNLAFAACVFMIAFMIGINSPSAEIGQVMPGTPADKAGLRVGDKITKINGRTIADRADLSAAVVLSDPDQPLTVAFLRKDPVTRQVGEHTVTMRPEPSADQGVLKIGVAPPRTTTASLVWNEALLRPEDRMQAGDKILAVNGKPVTRFDEVEDTLDDLRGRWAELTIHRPGTEDQPAGKDLQVRRRAHLFLGSSGRFEQEGGNLLGLIPRPRISDVFERQRGELAGLERGDAIVRWGNLSAPRLDEVLKNIKENPETDIPVVVLRGAGETKTLTVRPKVSGVLFKSEPQIGVEWYAQDTDHLVIADISTNVTDDIKTPAADLKTQIPRGSVLTKVNDEPVATWYDLADRFLKLAGTKVKLTWQYQSQPEQSAFIRVPHTLGTTFDLPPRHVITAINGVSQKEITYEGRRITVTVDHWIGAREILRDFVGQTVTVAYQGYADPTPRTAQITVTPEMLDTWTMRMMYMVDDLFTGVDLTLVRETNPIKAMMIGVQKTYYFIEQVYITMQRMIFTRSMGLEQVSGPVGIFKMGSDFAAAGLPILLYFLALISANLAVINFLPLPIVDGGLFLFLLIEKIKGGPISIRVQVATQVIGLALIIGIFLFVTFQDLQKLFG